ncbi:hypothetical protein [Moraxella sp.]|uniref:hypothetical protein n=1 Tax=Moraxella sp. TaxID=479 RepID=UPI0026DD48E0|nr:hypothetical protein [Moraxella sp.]MDO4895319.1 hypothetical protein [Moraxella sp.]
MTTALTTGTIEGVISASTTAYTIPKIDEYLKEQGFDETTRQTALLTLSATLGTTIGDSTASTANNTGQTQWNYLTHAELSAWKSRLTKCARNQQCIDNVNAEYDRANKTNFDNFENYCTINFDAQRCQNLIKRFQDGTQGTYNLKYLPGLYNDISRLGGKDANKTITSVKFNNAFYGYRVRDIGIVNVNRDNGNEFQALVGELANERLYGGGRGGTVAGSGGYRVNSAPISGDTIHGKARRAEASTDSHRSVGDSNKVVLEGKQYIDSETGGHVYVKGDRVVILNDNGIVISQFKNTRQNTLKRIRSGKWIPK